MNDDHYLLHGIVRLLTRYNYLITYIAVIITIILLVLLLAE